MMAANFPERYPFLYKEGFGFDDTGSVVKVDDVDQDHTELNHVRSYADWQVWVAENIADYLVNDLAGLEMENPSAYLRDRINARLHQDSE